MINKLRLFYHEDIKEKYNLIKGILETDDFKGMNKVWLVTHLIHGIDEQLYIIKKLKQDERRQKLNRILK